MNAQEIQGIKKIRNFRDLEIWKLGKKIALDIYKVTAKFPQNETFGLVIQMRRSAVSIVSNIAEGFNRFHNPEYCQFLYISLSSAAELETQIEIANELRYIDVNSVNDLLEDLDHESRMTRSLIKKLKDGPRSVLNPDDKREPEKRNKNEFQKYFTNNVRSEWRPRREG